VKFPGGETQGQALQGFRGTIIWKRGTGNKNKDSCGVIRENLNGK